MKSTTPKTLSVQHELIALSCHLSCPGYFERPYLKVANVSICQPKLLDVDFGFRHALEARFPGENRALAPLGFCQCHRSLMQNCQAKAFSQTFFYKNILKMGFLKSVNMSLPSPSRCVRFCHTWLQLRRGNKSWKQVCNTRIKNFLYETLTHINFLKNILHDFPFCVFVSNRVMPKSILWTRANWFSTFEVSC